MTLAIVALAAALAQPPAPPQPLELATLDAKLGRCTADFTVKGTDGAPVYGATIQVRIRYGAMSVKRMDLEIGTGSDGKARLIGLPAKAKPLTYEIKKGELKSTVSQNLATACHGTYDVTLK